MIFNSNLDDFEVITPLINTGKLNHFDYEPYW